MAYPWENDGVGKTRLYRWNDEVDGIEVRVVGNAAVYDRLIAEGWVRKASDVVEPEVEADEPDPSVIIASEGLIPPRRPRGRPRKVRE